MFVGTTEMGGAAGRSRAGLRMAGFLVWPSGQTVRKLISAQYMGVLQQVSRGEGIGKRHDGCVRVWVVIHTLKGSRGGGALYGVSVR